MRNINDTGNAASEKLKEETTKNDDSSVGSRIGHVIDAAINKVDQKAHEVKKEADKKDAEEKDVFDQIGDTLSHAYNYVVEKVSEATSGASYEWHKKQVKDSDNTVAERVGAGFSAVGDKIEEKVHKSKAEAHKEAL